MDNNYWARYWRNRLTRRTAATLLGLALGWWIAGMVPTHIPGVAISLAGETKGHDSDADQADSHGRTGHGAAQTLIPKQEDVPWFKPVLMAIVCLFGAALLFGSIALKLHGPEPPEPPDEDHEH